MVAVSQRASFPIGENVVLFDHLIGDCLFFLYERDTEVHGALFSFMESGLENGELCLFAYDNTEGRLHPEAVFGKYIEAGKLHLLPMGEKSTLEEVKNLSSKLAELCRRVESGKDGALRVVVDFGGLPTRSNVDSILDCVRKIMEKKDKKIRMRWNRTRYKTKKLEAPFPIRAITAFNADSLPNDALRELLNLHHNAVISARNQHTMSLLNYRPPELPDLPPVEAIPRQALEFFVKKHLETIVLALLSRSPMCGYDIIRTIYQRYHTFLSQGTVYPLLYSLEGEGLLSVMKSGSPRSKVYALTEEGKRVAEGKINDFISAQKYMLESIRKP
jgi:DNA-binding PadR family transcriptional regulator